MSTEYVPTDPDAKLRWKIERATKAYSFGHLQDLANLIRTLTRERITIAQFMEYMRDKQLERKGVIKQTAELRKRVLRERQAMMTLAPKCPDCNLPMKLGSTSDTNEAYWLCPKCSFSKYEPRAPQEVIAEIREKAGIKDT